MSEQGFRSTIIAALKPLHGVAVENRVGPGTPDVNYAEGWIELKWRKAWPKVGAEAHILFDHFTPQQRVWLRKRAERGGAVFLMAKIGPDYLLYGGEWASVHFGRATRAQMMLHARGYWRGKLDKKEFLKCLRS